MNHNLYLLESQWDSVDEYCYQCGFLLMTVCVNYVFKKLQLSKERKDVVIVDKADVEVFCCKRNKILPDYLALH